MARNVDFDWYLAQWMDTLHVTQADLCRATGFPKAKMSELVNGVSRYNRDVVNTLAKALHIRPHELLMHPDDANAIKRLRESAIRIAADNTPETAPQEARSEKPKKVS
jgi:transcriptional regulator with XRE-family HTH domain